MSDYISREAFIKWVEETYCKPCESEGRDYNHCRCCACQYDDMMRDAESFPSADVRPMVELQTNADRIRAMTDEELAEWISSNCVGDGYGNSTAEWLEWLKMEEQT